MKLYRYVLSFVMLVGISLSISAQSPFKQGIKQGTVKVKFTKAMSLSVRTMHVSDTEGNLRTGIKSFDQVSKKHAARKMTRIFPKHPNPDIEARHIKHGLHLWYVIEISESENPQDVAKAYAELGEVQLAEVEREKILAPSTVTEYVPGVSTMATLPFNDPYLIDQWHYNNSGQFTGAIAGSDINLFDAWSITAGSSEIIISVHDTGIDVKHNDLAANIWVNEAEKNGTAGVDDDNNGYIDDINGWNFNNNSATMEVHYHATHVAGTIAAVNNNGIGVSGVAGGTGIGDGARIMAIETIGGASATNIEAGFVYAADNGAVISQNSWGYTSPGAIEQSILDGIDYFIAEAGNYEGSPMKGGLVIFAAGNSGQDADFYPGYYENVLAVASIGADFVKAGYSNFGDWVDITAPGGNLSLNSKGGILSTFPDNKVGFLDGTSMACPHVSGVAALVLANRDHQYTPGELRNRLVTGVVDIDQYNPDFAGKMGAGLIDVTMALATDEKLPPAKINDLTLTSISQEFAIIDWTVPTDADDGQPTKFHIYYSSQPLDTTNLANAQHIELVNNKIPGDKESTEITGLLALTTYNFAIVSADRWGNRSYFSNIISGTTNTGPAIAVDTASIAIAMAINMAINPTSDHEITILNNDEGLLRWSFMSRQVSVPTPASFDNLNYPQIYTVKPVNVKPSISIGPSFYNVGGLGNTNFQTMSFETIYKEYASWSGAIVIGETDTDLTNSSATKYFVNESGGFNLTDIDMIIKHDSTTGPIIVEIYKGIALDKKNIIYAQEFNAPTTNAIVSEIHLNEQLYFAEGETFWIVFHIPSGNLYPLGIGNEFQPEYSDYCYMSFDLGETWETLESAIGYDNYAWTTTAISKNEYLGEYLTLTPDAGEVQGNSQTLTTLSADGSLLINGAYEANVILSSNDSKNSELRLPVTLTVSGHQPQLYSPVVLDFGSVFNGTSKQMTILVENSGYGHWNNIVVTSSNTDYTVINAPTDIYARDSYSIIVEYNPILLGTASGTITLQADGITHNISVYANSIEPPVNSVSPLQQTITPIALTDSVTAVITVTNTGGYPLAYYVPGWGNPSVLGEITGKVHQYGYRVLTNETGAANPATYVWNDISTTGTNISQFFKDRDFSQAGPAFHYTVPLEFKMPFYSHVYDTVYITEQGMIDFENSVRLVNYPRLEFDWGPSGFISAFGEQIGMAISGNVYFMADQNRFIVQYDNVTFEWLSELPPVTFQIEMLPNGDINLYYKDVMNFINTGTSISSGYDFQRVANVIVEDPEKLDGIQLNGYNGVTKQFEVMDWKDGLAVTFEYPGPDIIYAMNNASGSVLAGESRDITVNMATASLYEGIIKRSINIISNDPFSGSIIASANLEITSGGLAQIEVSTTSIDFGQVFQGAQVSEGFIVKNHGTASSNVSVSLAVGNYIITGNTPVVIPARKLAKYVVQLPTTTVGIVKDTISITDSAGNIHQIILAGEVLDPPDINVDLSQINLILKYGQKVAYPITIESSGIADLEVSVTGTDWLSIAMEQATIPTNNTYSWKSSKGDSTGFTYNWIDITKSGTRIHDDSLNFQEGSSWAPVKLPFTFNFYGQPYDTIYMSYNGILAFSNDKPSLPFAEFLPPVDHGYPDGPDNFIAPLWVSGGFDIYTYGDISGLYYEVFSDRVVITYSYIVNVFGMGQPISHQTILYPNGTIKFQYKKEENDDWEEYTTKLGSIGVVNKGSTDYVQISGLNTIGIGGGLAFALIPTQTYLAPAGTTLNATMNFDASTVYAGVYPGAITYHTKVPGSELLQRPVTLRVTGDPALSYSSDTIDYQTVYAYQENGIPVSYQKEFTISNTGVADLKFATMALAVADPDFKLEIYYKDIWDVWAWRDASYIGEMPSIIPNGILPARISLTPTKIGAINNRIIITSQLPNDTIIITGNVFIPAEISVPQDSLTVTFQLKTETDQRTIELRNNGGYNLAYNLSVEYARASAAQMLPGSSIASTNSKPTGLGLTEAVGTPITIYGDEIFNRVLSHENATQAENFLGYSGAGQLIASTRFNAGSEGFNLTHVQTFFRPENALDGTISVEVKAGGSGIEDAISLTQVDYTYSYASSDSIGSWVTIPLNEAQILAPNEDFYLIFTYPMNIDYPQGLISGVDDVAGRYMLEYQNSWYDLQVEVESGMAYLMRAAEETYASGEWVVINSVLDSTLAVGDVSNIDLEFIAANAQQGWQSANLVIASNDPLNPVVKIPMSLYLNAGPVFTNVPTGIQNVDEADTLTLVVTVNDPEGNSFTVESKEVYEGVSYSLTGSQFTIEITPGYDDEGSYVYSFVGTDEFYATNTMDIQVTVNNTNRAPESIPTPGFIYDINDEFEEYYFTDYFTDPDGDSLSFSISIGNDTIADVFTGDERFVIVPKSLGETSLTIIATDVYGATSSLEILVTVENQLVLGIEQALNPEVSVYPNPTTDKVQLTWKNDWTEEVTLVITSITGAHIGSYEYKKINKGSTIELDMSRFEIGVYVLKIASKDKTTLLRIIKQ